MNLFHRVIKFKELISKKTSQKKITKGCFLLLYCLFSVCSCTKENQELKCNQYYLTEVRSNGAILKLYYTTDGHLSAIKSSQGQKSSFIYDGSKRLKEVIDPSARVIFHFDPKNQLIASNRIGLNGSKIDSAFIEYDQENRIIRFNKFSEYDYHLSYYQIYKYLDEKTVQIDFYGQDANLSTDPLKYWGSFKYILDGKQKPFPAEYYYHSLTATNAFLPSNYISLQSFGGKNSSTDSYMYIYNSAGYPVTGGLSEYKYECEPKFE